MSFLLEKAKFERFKLTRESEKMSDLKEPERFPFPFTPYDIQEDFMRDLYRVIAYGRIGIFESPTGTVGK